MLTTEVSFGFWLKQQRKTLDLTQDELAERVGCSIDLIRKIEAGRRRPSRYIAERIAPRSRLHRKSGRISCATRVSSRPRDPSPRQR